MGALLGAVVNVRGDLLFQSISRRWPFGFGSYLPLVLGFVFLYDCTYGDSSRHWRCGVSAVLLVSMGFIHRIFSGTPATLPASTTIENSEEVRCGRFVGRARLVRVG